MKLEKIRALCMKKSMSLIDLENEVGLGNGTICKWEGKNPGVENVKRVADYFGTTVDNLLKD